MKKISEYVGKQLKKVQPGIKEWDDAGYKDTPNAKIGDTYSLEFGEIITVLNSNHETNTVPLEITISKPKKNLNSVSSLNSLNDLGMKFRSEVMSHKNFLETFIASIVPGPLSTKASQFNPDIYEIKINLTFEVNQPL